MIKIRVKANGGDPSVYRRLLKAQDEAIRESLEQLAVIIIALAQEILRTPSEILGYEHLKGDQGNTVSGKQRHNPVGFKGFNDMIVEGFTWNRTGSNKYNRVVNIQNDAPLAAEIHDGTPPGRIELKGLLGRLKRWADGKGVDFTATELLYLRNLIVERGVPALPYLEAAAWTITHDSYEAFIKRIQDRIRQEFK